jgi:voltage-gated potassium channel
VSEAVAAVCLVLATVAVHLSGFSLVVHWLHGVATGGRLASGPAFVMRLLLLLSLWIVVLHMSEVAIWAAFYQFSVGFGWRNAVYFSLGCYSTVGATQIALPDEWRLLEGIEAVAGALMFGLSTALIFAVMNEVHFRWHRLAPEQTP